MAPSITGEAQNFKGLWPQTASIDWCEANYVWTPLIAEFWNTLSNLVFVIPGLIQLYLLRNSKLEKSFTFAFLNLAIVGVGSFCFHMTLSRSMQMFDETSMILITLHVFYLQYIIIDPKVNKLLLKSILVCYGIVFLAFYVYLVEMPLFHHLTFAVLVYSSTYLGYLLKKEYTDRHLFWIVVTLQHIGLGFWLIDKRYCDTLIDIRNNLPSILRPLFQFHALWHVHMSIASYLFVCSLIKLRAWIEFKEDYGFKFHPIAGLVLNLKSRAE